MSKSTNVNVSMSPQCARAWRRLERSFRDDGEMLPSMVRGLADAWDESGKAIGEATDALDLESRSVAPFTRLSLTALGARLSARDDEIFASRDHALKVAGRDSKRLLTIAGTVEFRVRRYRGPDGRPRYLLFEDTGICAPREKTSRGLKAFVASMACEQAYRPAAAHVAVFSREPVSPAAVKDAIESCAAPLAALAEDASLRRLNGELVGTARTATLFMEADGVYCHLQRTKAMKEANAPRWAQVRDAKAYEGKERGPGAAGANRCGNPLVYAAVEDAVTFADRLAGLVNARWDLSDVKHAYWGCDGEKAYQDIGELVKADAMGVLDRWHLNDKILKLAPKPLVGPMLKAIDAIRPDLALKAVSDWMSIAAHECAGRESDRFSRTMGKLTELYGYIASNQARITDASLGTMEATNAHVVCARTKHTGLAWSVAGLDSMVRCRASLAGTDRLTLRPMPCTPGDQRPASHVAFEQTDGYRLKPPLTATQANRMRNGKGSTAKQARIATAGNRKRSTRRSTR
ncbi:UPF0236 family transposase-like protein [Bifidobacterium felsineum]|uniref:UPF0236 family transposase-like protein n=1 Tax=Bifidobacterium felsineum TaxID=2045440 RepID=UPI001BDD510E|nr:UPF0236 family protein [Bifidobacterium felsineum]MBT1165169.1 UPF0236 family protein [Bifidobacterium felsineum]